MGARADPLAGRLVGRLVEGFVANGWLQADAVDCTPTRSDLTHAHTPNAHTHQPGHSGVEAPGTYLGVVEKLDHLQRLGVNAMELLPVFEFNELEYYSPIPGQVRGRLVLDGFDLGGGGGGGRGFGDGWLGVLPLTARISA